jgi:hypothetical protein
VAFGVVDVGAEALNANVLELLTGGWLVGSPGSCRSPADVFAVLRADLVPIGPADIDARRRGDPAGASAVLCTVPACGSTVVGDGDAEPVGEPASGADDELDVLVSVVGEPDGLEDEADVLAPDESASATPGMVVTADPMPSAIANAPTRPTYLTAPIIVPCSRRCPALKTLRRTRSARTETSQSCRATLTSVPPDLRHSSGGSGLRPPKWCTSWTGF